MLRDFVTTQLILVLKNSHLFDEMLGNYVEHQTLEMIGYNKRLIANALDDYTCECVELLLICDYNNN